MNLQIIDSHLPSSNFLAAMLGAHYSSLEVAVTPDKESTLATIHTVKPGLVLISTALSWSNGVAVANLIKKQYGTEIRVILISDDQALTSDLIDSVLIRPFPIATLYALVDTWLDDQALVTEAGSNSKANPRSNGKGNLLVRLRRLVMLSESR